MGRSRGKRRNSTQRSDASGIVLGSLTHVGMVRSSNQDAYCALLAPNAPQGSDALLAVADGMGGHQAGEVASTMAIQGLVQRLSNQGAGDATPVTEPRLPALLGDVISQVNAEVSQAALRPETRGMGTTLTAGLLLGETLFLEHVGDSRAYRWREGQLELLTRDDSLVQWLVTQGQLDPEEAFRHPLSNQLLAALDGRPEDPTTSSVVALQRGDRLLFCSDGLSGFLRTEQIAASLAAGRKAPEETRSLVEQVKALQQAEASLHIQSDNISVVLVQID